MWALGRQALSAGFLGEGAAIAKVLELKNNPNAQVPEREPASLPAAG